MQSKESEVPKTTLENNRYKMILICVILRTIVEKYIFKGTRYTTSSIDFRRYLKLTATPVREWGERG